MALDTLANVKTQLKIGTDADDATLNRLLSAAESFIEQHTRRAFAGGTFTETHPADARFLFLANFPVATVTTLRVDPNRTFVTETARATTEYVILAERGVIASLTGPFLPPRSDGWPAAVQITYTTPTSQVPAAVKEAFTQLVGHWYREVKTNEGLAFKMLTEDTSGTTTKTYSWSLTSGLKVPTAVLQLLEPLRVPAI